MLRSLSDVEKQVVALQENLTDLQSKYDSQGTTITELKGHLTNLVAQYTIFAQQHLTLTEHHLAFTEQHKKLMEDHQVLVEAYDILRARIPAPNASLVSQVKKLDLPLVDLSIFAVSAASPRDRSNSEQNPSPILKDRSKAPSSSLRNSL